MPLPNKPHFHLPPIIHLRLSVDTTLNIPPSHPPPIPSPPPPPPPPSPVILPLTRRHRPRQLRKLSNSHYWPPGSTQVPTTSAALQILGTLQDGALDEFVVNATRLISGFSTHFNKFGHLHQNLTLDSEEVVDNVATRRLPHKPWMYPNTNARDTGRPEEKKTAWRRRSGNEKN